MQIYILAVGKIRERYLKEGIEDFILRIRPYVNLTVTDIAQERAVDTGDSAIRQICSREGGRIMREIPNGSLVIALDPAGRSYTSESFANCIRKYEIDGPHTIVFVIGGSHGLSPEVKKQADELLSFSSMTFPHQVARFLLLEQLYRAFRIIRGEPYHK